MLVLVICYTFYIKPGMHQPLSCFNKNHFIHPTLYSSLYNSSCIYNIYYNFNKLFKTIIIEYIHHNNKFFKKIILTAHNNNNIHLPLCTCSTLPLQLINTSYGNVRISEFVVSPEICVPYIKMPLDV